MGRLRLNLGRFAPFWSLGLAVLLLIRPECSCATCGWLGSFADANCCSAGDCGDSCDCCPSSDSSPIRTPCDQGGDCCCKPLDNYYTTQTSEHLPNVELIGLPAPLLDDDVTPPSPAAHLSVSVRDHILGTPLYVRYCAWLI